ncbi:MAG: YidC/Oxa1 family membrane protein insertase [Defluviitaleaceae bacterium]|nr:YidC/Oxa1 family membrane protein insertase [Defluviitaleaceae bacterium]
MFDFINTVLGIPLGGILRAFYILTGHFGVSVLIFAVLVRIIMLPTNLLAHRNSIKFLRLQPALFRIKKQFSVDAEAANAASYKLFKEQKYRPMLGLLPLLAQLFLLIGVLQVMYRPLQHVLGWSRDAIDLATYSMTGMGAEIPVAAASGIDMNFLGLDLGAVPSFSEPVLLIVPFLSGLTAFIFCMFQTKYSPGALTQSARANMGLTLFTVGFSVYFAWVIPASVGVYWIVGNILGVGVTLWLNAALNPKKLAPEAYEHIISTRKTKDELKTERELKKRLNTRSRADGARFRAAKKELVFYALTGGQYKYYATTIDYLLKNSDITIHYLTNDPNDKVFDNINHERFKSYFVTERKAIGLLLRLECAIMATTVQDLQTYHIKRSIAKLDIEYIHIPHGPASLHLTAREAAYDHFDTFFCVGPHQANELRRREEMAGLHKKTLVKAGYGLYDQLLERVRDLPEKTDTTPQILIAPSWQPENILDICAAPLINGLLGRGWRVIVRPHPQHLQVFPEVIDELKAKFGNEIIIDTDFLSNENIFTSDVLITDWSGIAFEFSFTTLRPSIFVDTPMKVLNPGYQAYELPVTDILFRDKVGVSVSLQNVGEIGNVVDKLLADKDAFGSQIEAVAKEYIYHHGRSGEASAKFIIKRLRG